MFWRLVFQNFIKVAKVSVPPTVAESPSPDLQSFSLDVPRIAPVMATAALY